MLLVSVEVEPIDEDQARQFWSEKGFTAVCYHKRLKSSALSMPAEVEEAGDA